MAEKKKIAKLKTAPARAKTPAVKSAAMKVSKATRPSTKGAAKRGPAKASKPVTKVAPMAKHMAKKPAAKTAARVKSSPAKASPTKASPAMAAPARAAQAQPKKVEIKKVDASAVRHAGKSVSKPVSNKSPAQAAVAPAHPVATAGRSHIAPARMAAAVIAAAARPASASPAAGKAVTAALPKPAAKTSAPLTPKDIAAKAAEARQHLAQQQVSGPRKPVSQRHGFKTNEFIVYPAHGVGRIVGIEEQEIAGMSLELFVITFDKDKMTLRVPTGKLQSVGMRKLSEEATVKKAMETLKGRARVKRTMWSRRAQEYEAKINSGDLVSIAEVVRDLYRSEMQPEQSYSERQLFEAALDRMAREIAAVDKLDDRGAVQRITEVLSKSARGRRLAAEGEAAGAGAEVKAA